MAKSLPAVLRSSLPPNNQELFMRMASRDAPLRSFIASEANDRAPQRFGSLYSGDDVRMHNPLQLKYGMTGVEGQHKNHRNPLVEAAKRIRGVIACWLLLLIE